MEAPVGLNGTIPVSASQAARKEWRAMPDHSYRSNGGEEREHLNVNQSAERTIHEVQVGSGRQDVEFCSLTIDVGSQITDDMLQRKLQEISRLREQLQQMEIELARTIARSEVLEMQNTYEVKLKEQIDINNNLKEQLREREKRLLELERKVEEKERELHTMKIDSEAAWAKEDLLREQNKELANYRERDNSEAERAQHLSQIHDFQELIQDKEGQILALQEQHRVAQETIHFKEEQLREAHTWIARVQEMDALQSSTNQSLQVELRERIEHVNQYWISIQRQFLEMEHHHMQAIQQLQLELAEARGNNGKHKDGSQVARENSVDSSNSNASQINVIDGGKSNAQLGFSSNGSVDGTSAYVSTSNPSSKQPEHVPDVPLVPSTLMGMNSFIPPGQIASLHPYMLNPLSVPHPATSTNLHIPQSHMDPYQSIPIIPNHQQWQNQRVLALSDVSQIPNESKHPLTQTQHGLLGSDTHYSFNLPGELGAVHQEHLSSHGDKQVPSHSGNGSSEEVQVLRSNIKQSSVTQQSQGTLDAPPHLDSASEYYPSDKKTEIKAEDVLPSENKSLEEGLKSGQEWPASSVTISTRQISVSSNGTAESTIFAAPVSNTLMPSNPPLEPKLLDERSLLVCIVRAIPAGSDGKIRISTTLPNRLGKMLAPLHWHDYKKCYGKLDEFLAHHPELFVIEGDFIHLREGAQQIISATAAFAKVAAAASASSAPYTSLLSSVAVTPVAQVNRQKVTQSIESKAAISVPLADAVAMANAGVQSDTPTQILTRQDPRPNDARSNLIQGLSNVTISNKLKNVQEANALPSGAKLGNVFVHSAVGNTSNLDRTNLSWQNKGTGNGRHSLGGKQLGRSSGSNMISRR
ncbi:stress response protein NST1-like isoform X3 [Zingiber officinale]|uniref:stress response protein NST1-like isoform X3 n=1 Tax=Zingiber officinale TaxID=94328 RepID=UPI001C4D39D4|nr:stress response protein NST1-like isoform X3 [Zingiber officinale]